MNWQLAVDKHHEALKRVLTMLVAMIEAAGGRSATLPRHLHRFVLRLLRPAEAATRRLIIVAARGLVVKLPAPRLRKPPRMQSVLVNDGGLIGVLEAPILQPRRVDPPRIPSLPLLDPLKRPDIRQRYSKPSAMPQVGLLGGDGPFVPFFGRPEPLSPPAPDDPLDAACIHRRLETLSRALDDLPGQAKRMARWQASRDARLAAEGAASGLGKEQSQAPSGRPAQPNTIAQRSRYRFNRIEPMRPGRPLGRRRNSGHRVYVNGFHGVAVWAREHPDTS